MVLDEKRPSNCRNIAPLREAPAAVRSVSAVGEGELVLGDRGTPAGGGAGLPGN